MVSLCFDVQQRMLINSVYKHHSNNSRHVFFKDLTIFPKVDNNHAVLHFLIQVNCSILQVLLTVTDHAVIGSKLLHLCGQRLAHFILVSNPSGSVEKLSKCSTTVSTWLKTLVSITPSCWQRVSS